MKKKNYNKEFFIKKMKISSIISLSLSLIMLIIFILFLDTVSKLSIISPWAFFALLILFIIYNIITVFISFKFNERIDFENTKLYFKFYDNINFIIKTILILSTIIMFVVTPTTVIGNSMNDTLESNDKILIWHMGYKPKKDDIVIINVTKEKYGSNVSVDDSLYVKRVVATSKDNVSYNILTNEFMVNGIVVEDSEDAISYLSYLKCINFNGKSDNVSLTFVVPNGYSIVMGDHRTNSQDSRELGLIDNNDILGKAFIRLFPFKSFGKLNKKTSYN